MARILIAYFSDYGEAMYDAITKVLRKNGNDIFRLNINNQKIKITNWGGNSKIINKSLLEKIKLFNPDLIFNFNNCLPQNCFPVLKNDCKICAIDADAPKVAFWNKKTIEENFNKYIWLGLQSYSKTMYEEYLKKQLNNDNYLYFPPATIVKNEKLNIDKNITFIGSNFYPLAIPTDGYFYSKNALEVYKKFKENYFYKYENANKKFNCDSDNFELISAYYVGQDRLKFMQQLTDLGFVFYGVRHWNRIAYYDFELAKCFDDTKITTLEENQWVYNTSKISVNFSHPLAKSSFSWRVMDIMASNACLLMENKPDWRDLFEKYLSKETLEAVIYKDRFDMRDKAKKLLNDENFRLKCVKELNYAIEQNGRWEVRFKNLEKFLNIKLVNIKNTKNEYIFITRDEDNPIQKKKTFIQRLKIKNRIKIFFYSILLAIAQIPILDLALNKVKRKKVYKKIDKHWR